MTLGICHTSASVLTSFVSFPFPRTILMMGCYVEPIK